MKKKLNSLLLAFFEKHKDDIAYDDLVNFNNLWARIYDEVDDDVLDKGRAHY